MPLSQINMSDLTKKTSDNKPLYLITGTNNDVFATDSVNSAIRYLTIAQDKILVITTRVMNADWVELAECLERRRMPYQIRFQTTSIAVPFDDDLILLYLRGFDGPDKINHGELYLATNIAMYLSYIVVSEKTCHFADMIQRHVSTLRELKLTNVITPTFLDDVACSLKGSRSLCGLVVQFDEDTKCSYVDMVDFVEKLPSVAKIILNIPSIIDSVSCRQLYVLICKIPKMLCLELVFGEIIKDDDDDREYSDDSYEVYKYELNEFYHKRLAEDVTSCTVYGLNLGVQGGILVPGYDDDGKRTYEEHTPTQHFTYYDDPIVTIGLFMKLLAPELRRELCLMLL